MHTVVRVFAVALAVLAVAALVGAAVLRGYDWNSAKDGIAAAIGAHLGTEVAIDGILDIDARWGTVTVRAEEVRVAGTLPSPRPLLAFDAATVELAVWPLLAGEIVLRRAAVSNPTAHLIRNERGEVNWDFEKEPEDEEPLTLPVIESLEVEHAALSYRDAALDRPLNLSLERVTGALPADGAGVIAGAGRLESQPLTLELRVERADGEGNFRIDGALALSDAELRLTGTTATPDLRVHLRAPESAELGFLPIPEQLRAADFVLAGRLTRDSERWLLADLEASLGPQRLTGDIRLDADATPPMLDARLRLNRLELPARKRDKSENAEVIPSTPIEVSPLRQMNARIDLRIGTVTNAPAPMEKLAFVMALQGGRLTVSPLSAAVAGGKIEGAIEFDASHAVPVAVVRLTASALDLGKALPGDGEPPVAGRVSGRIDLRTHGADVEKLLGNIDGQLLFVMRSGSVAAAAVKAVDLDLAQLLVASASGARTPIRCAFIALEAKDGVLRPHPVVVDTRDSTISLEGLVNLSAETLALTLRAYPKDPSPLSGRGPIRIEGSFANPSVDVFTPPVAARGAAALALGALLGPIAGLLPLVEPGLGESPDCRYLLADIPAGGAGGVRSKQ